MTLKEKHFKAEKKKAPIKKIKTYLKLRPHIFSILIGVWFFQFNGFSQKLSPKDYIESFKENAVKEMCVNKIPASIVLAQAMFESANGNSELAKNANNHFGIKCKKEWYGASYSKDDEEQQECFRKYISVLESYTDHSTFLKTSPRYAFLFDIPVTDYKSWCVGLKEAGYATDPKYAKHLIDIIEKYKLYELVDKSLINFKIQIGALNKPANVADMNARLKGLEGVGKQTTVTGRVRFTIGKYSGYNEAEKARKEMEDKGFPEAFIIATFKEEIISLREAMELLK
jgi:hypothetical protein